MLEGEIISIKPPNNIPRDRAQFAIRCPGCWYEEVVLVWAYDTDAQYTCLNCGTHYTIPNMSAKAIVVTPYSEN